MLRTLLSSLLLLLCAACFVGACRAPLPAEDPAGSDSARVVAVPGTGRVEASNSTALAEALAAYESGDYGAALQAIDRESRLASDGRIQVVKACLLLFARSFGEAAALLADAENDPLARQGVRVGRAHLLINDKNYQGAQELAEGIASSPLSSSEGAPEGYEVFVYELACLAMAWSEANSNQHVRAIRWFDRILVGQADDLLGLLGRGNSLIALNLLSEARETLERVLDAHPSNPYALAELGMILLKEGKEEAAEEHFQKALAKDDAGYTCPHEGLGLLYLRQGRSDEAKQHLEQAIRINPDIEYKKYNGLARIYLEDGNIAEAERLLEKSIANFPHDGEARELLKRLRGSRDRAPSPAAP